MKTKKDLEFYREDITFLIKEDFFLVEGIYFFRNNTNRILIVPLYYPFSKKGTYGEVTDCVIFKDNEKIETKMRENACHFTLKIKPYEDAKYLIKYKQKILNYEAKYILTSTQEWEQPLECANYNVVVDEDCKINSFSYKPDKKDIKDKKKYYYWHKENFMPDKDFIINYEPLDKFLAGKSKQNIAEYLYEIEQNKETIKQKDILISKLFEIIRKLKEQLNNNDN